MSTGRFNGLRAMLLVALLLLVASLGVFLAASEPVGFGEGCGDDGLQYCKMAQGQTALRPYSRRLLLPWLLRVAGVSPVDLPAAFRVVNVLALILTAVMTAALVHLLARAWQAPARRCRSAAALGAVLLLLMPMGLRWTLYYPVLVDHFAAAFGVGWMLVVGDRDRRVRWAGVPLALLAVLARESWLPVIVVAVITRAVIARERRRLLTAATIAAAVAGGLVVFSVRGLPNPFTEPLSRYAWFFLRYFLTTASGLREFTWMTLFGLGLVPLLVFVRAGRWFTFMRKDAESAEPMAWPMLVAVAAQVGLALIGGGDVHRFLASIAPFVLALVLAHVAVNRDLDVILALILFGSVLLWRPLQVLEGTKESYLAFFSPRYLPSDVIAGRFSRDLLIAVSPLLCVLAVTLNRTFAGHRLAASAPVFYRDRGATGPAVATDLTGTR